MAENWSTASLSSARRRITSRSVLTIVPGFRTMSSVLGTSCQNVGKAHRLCHCKGAGKLLAPFILRSLSSRSSTCFRLLTTDCTWRVTKLSATPRGHHLRLPRRRAPAPCDFPALRSHRGWNVSYTATEGSHCTDTWWQGLAARESTNQGSRVLCPRPPVPRHAVRGAWSIKCDPKLQIVWPRSLMIDVQIMHSKTYTHVNVYTHTCVYIEISYTVPQPTHTHTHTLHWGEVLSSRARQHAGIHWPNWFGVDSIRKSVR